jgi:predicted nicotinamide N-methyase
MSAAREGTPAELEERFDVVEGEVEIGDATFAVLRPRNAEALISEEDFARDERLPYWADVWPSSIALGRRLLEERGAGRRLLELGSGVGVVALAAARAGFDVTVSDYYEDALLFARANLARAGLAAESRHLDWRALPDDLPTYDLVVASDVLYERPYAELVADVIARALAPDGLALVADPGRLAAPAFVEAARARDLVETSADVRPVRVGEITQRITIHALRRRPASA